MIVEWIGENETSEQIINFFKSKKISLYFKKILTYVDLKKLAFNKNIRIKKNTNVPTSNAFSSLVKGGVWKGFSYSVVKGLQNKNSDRADVIIFFLGNKLCVKLKKNNM